MFKKIKKILKKDTHRDELEDTKPIGNGKAVFLGEGTQEEFIDQERKDSGLKGWYDRLRNL